MELTKFGDKPFGWLRGIRIAFVTLCLAAPAVPPAFAADPTFAELLAKAEAQAAAGHRWDPPGDNMTETVMQMMDLIPSATPDQISALSALLERDKAASAAAAVAPSAIAQPPRAAAAPPSADTPRAAETPAKIDLPAMAGTPTTATLPTPQPGSGSAPPPARALASTAADQPSALQEPGNEAGSIGVRKDQPRRGPDHDQVGSEAYAPGETKPMDIPPLDIAPRQTGPAPAASASLPPSPPEPRSAAPMQAGPSQMGPAQTGSPQTGPAQTRPTQTARLPAEPALSIPLQLGLGHIATEPWARDGNAAGKASPPPGSRAGLLFSRGIDAELRGDISGARRFYLSAAEQGDAAAARNLGRLYDPAYVRQIAVGGIDANATVAQQWYERAVRLGDDEAAPLLQALSAR